ncbi:hypothetical protein B0H16DRAFT_1735358 [Mycena metata]|uniref:Uncharacterized protein n=1 Tax=Mycena metata TaxID=1033252 RepID=A0AAD7HS28_9AGAR|nr:hypothetical protein B0H16DRAFT_1735358 [Mycena metata]
MSDTPPLFWEVIVAGKAMLHDFTGFERCTACVEHGFECAFDGWGAYCGECLMFRRAACTYISKTHMHKSFDIVDAVLPFTDIDDKEFHLTIRGLARPFVDYWFDNARLVNRRTPLVDTFKTVLAGHNSPIMLRDLLEFLTTSGGDAALIDIVRARLNVVTASN